MSDLIHLRSICYPFINISYSGLVKLIRQIGVEFHQVHTYITMYAAIVKDLYRMGFKIISWEPNYTTQKGKYGYDYFEIVFRQTEICPV